MSKNKVVVKEEDIKVKLSSSFMARARCKYCGSYPSYYYRFGGRGNRCKKDHRAFIDLFSWIPKHQYRLCEDFYLGNSPKNYTLMSFLNYSLYFIDYNPSLHHKRGLKEKSSFNECLTCDCGKSCWVFNQKSVINRKEIYHRKSSKNFPKIFKY